MRVLAFGDFTRPQYHPFQPVFDVLQKSLVAERFTLDGSEDRTLLSLEKLSAYDVILMYSDAPGETLGDEAVGALEAYIAQGKGLVAVHCAVLFADEALHRLIGARFLNHPPYQKLHITRKAPEHLINQDISDFDIEDELYIMEMVGDDDRQVFLECTLGGGPQPVAWTRTLGQGRMVYHALGHSEASFRNPAFKKIIINSLRWAGNANR